MAKRMTSSRVELWKGYVKGVRSFLGKHELFKGPENFEIRETVRGLLLSLPSNYHLKRRLTALREAGLGIENGHVNAVMNRYSSWGRKKEFQLLLSLVRRK